MNIEIFKIINIKTICINEKFNPEELLFNRLLEKTEKNYSSGFRHFFTFIYL